MNYVIWSYEHRAWWGPGRCGYTNHLEQAGRYDLPAAGDIVSSSIHMEEIAVPEHMAENHGPPPFHAYHGEVDHGERSEDYTLESDS